MYKRQGKDCLTAALTKEYNDHERIKSEKPKAPLSKWAKDVRSDKKGSGCTYETAIYYSDLLTAAYSFLQFS